MRAAFLVIVLTLGACQAGGGQDSGSSDSDSGDSGSGDSGSGDSGSGDSGSGETGDGGGDQGEDGGDYNSCPFHDYDDYLGSSDPKDIAVVRMEGDRLYSLATYSDLTVVDMTNPDDVLTLGAWESDDDEPFEMYVDNGRVLAIFIEYQEEPAYLEKWEDETRTHLVALDAQDPQNISLESEITLVGRIQSAYHVGDILYVSARQGGCNYLPCGDPLHTAVISIDISNLAQPLIVDQLVFEGEPNSNGEGYRTVASSSERLYAAKTDWFEEIDYIDVIDISAGDGSLIEGDRVPITGNLRHSYQIDEYEGTLRVITDTMLETFTIESSQSIVPLGSSLLSQSNNICSIHFDGDRLYMATADELIMHDLSNPAFPVQAAVVESSDWVYRVEPRGDRVLTLGRDYSPEGNLEVSLFDVSVFDQPTLRGRVHFGATFDGEGTSHDAFTIVDDEQMILVSQTSDNGCVYDSGVQIIDWLDDDLSLRGVAPAHGTSRFAFTHGERIVTLSDLELATFDYADRDAPVAVDDLGISVEAFGLVRAADAWVRVVYDHGTMLDIVPADDPESLEPLATIELEEDASCDKPGVAGVFPVDNHLFVVGSDGGVDDFGVRYWDTSVTSIDISELSAPVVLQTLDLPDEQDFAGCGSCTIRGGVVMLGSSWGVQQGNYLVFNMNELYYDANTLLIDVSNPAALAFTKLDRPTGETLSPLSVMSDTVVSWRTVLVQGQSRYYFNRLALDGEPSWGPEVEVPGLPIAWDAQTSRAYAVGFEVYETDLDGDACHDHPRFWAFDYFETETCKLVNRTLNQVEIVGTEVTLLNSIEIDGDIELDRLYTTNSRIFSKTYDENESMVVFDLDADDPEPLVFDGEQFGQGWSIAATDGVRAVARGDDDELSLINASDLLQIDVLHSSMSGWTRCHHPVIDGDNVHCVMGPYGLHTVDW